MMELLKCSRLLLKKILKKSESFKIYFMPTEIFHSRHTPRSMTSYTFDAYNLLAFKIYYKLFSTSVEASICLKLFFLMFGNSFNLINNFW